MSASATQEASFTDTPSGWASRLAEEFKAARSALHDWHEQARDALGAYSNEKRDGSGAGQARFNVFTADTQTQEAILFGNPPRVVVTRRFADAKDDMARVASEIQERLLNADVDGDDDTFAAALGYAHWERQVVGFGLCRVRYEMGQPEKTEGTAAITHPDTGQELAPAVPSVEKRPDEEVETDWVHWADALWGSCRVWHEVPWVAFSSDISRSQAAEKFGEKVASQLPIKGKSPNDEKKAASPWDRVRLWEVWVKEEKQVFFFVEGWPEVLKPQGVEVDANGGQADPLGLEGFFPCPQPMLANTTTSKLVPKPDYALQKGLYQDINTLAARIALLEDAIGVKGAYDKANSGLKRLLDEAGNVLVPVDNWALFQERGGMRGSVDWFPLEQVVSALAALQGRLTEKVDQLRQLTGMSDIMRGQTEVPGATATEQRIKARFGSVRMEKRQKELARFATDLQRLRAEVMTKHFDTTTLLARCNCENTADAQLAPQAVDFLKSNLAKYRIEVKPETISMTDFDALKQERTEVVSAISQYLTAVAPIAQSMPGSQPYLLQILQWMIAGLRGSSEIEGVLDQAIAQAQQAAQNPQPQQQGPNPMSDPKVIAQQMKGQQDMARSDKELQNSLTLQQAEVSADAQKQENQAIWNTKELAMKEQVIAATRPMGMKPGGGMP